MMNGKNKIYALGFWVIINLLPNGCVKATSYVPGSCSILGFCADEVAYAHTKAFKQQLNSFACGQAFWQGIHTHVKDHLLAGVGILSQQYPTDKGLPAAHKEIEVILMALNENKEAIVNDYDAQSTKIYEQRSFTAGPVADVAEQLTKLTAAVCDGEPSRADLHKLYAVYDQYENIKMIQKTMPAVEQLCAINSKTFRSTLLPSGSWSRFFTKGFILGGLVVGGVLVLAAYKDKVDAILLKGSAGKEHDEQVEELREHLNSRLNTLLEKLQQKQAGIDGAAIVK